MFNCGFSISVVTIQIWNVLNRSDFLQLAFSKHDTSENVKLLCALKKLWVLCLKWLISQSIWRLKRKPTDRHQINNQRQFRQQLAVLFFQCQSPQNSYFNPFKTMKAYSELVLRNKRKEKTKAYILDKWNKYFQAFPFLQRFKKRTKLKSNFWK